MAKQNFLAGGYYGKLGMTVGQRWKNIRTIRTYVIPHNPRTPSQQANRGKFGDCVFYAQVANQMNFNATCFQHESITKWNYRMKTARALQDLGLDELMRFPLYPSDFSVPYLITEASVTQFFDQTHIEVTVGGTLPETERVLNLLLLLPGTEPWQDRLAICQGTNSSADYSKFTFRLPEDLPLSEGLQGRFISIDDEDSSTDLISSTQLSIPIATIDEHEFNTTVRDISRTNNTFTITLSEPYQSGTMSVTVDRLKEVNNGLWETLTSLDVSLINNGGYFALAFTCPNADNQNLWAFPAGSELHIASISLSNSTTLATATDKTLALSSSDLTRTYKNTFTSQTRNGSTYYFNISKALPYDDSKSGAVMARAIVNGTWQNLICTGYTIGDSWIEWNSGITDVQLLPAFPSGATVTANVTIVGKGVTYTPETVTAQSVVGSSDLVRIITAQPQMRSSSGVAYIVFPLSGLTSKADTTVQLQTKHNKYLFEQTQSYEWVYNADSEGLVMYTNDEYGLPFALNGSWFNGTSTVFAIASGVTYRLQTQSFFFDSHLVTPFVSGATPNTVFLSNFTVDFNAPSGGTVPTYSADGFEDFYQCSIASTELGINSDGEDIDLDSVDWGSSSVTYGFTCEWNPELEEGLEGLGTLHFTDVVASMTKNGVKCNFQFSIESGTVDIDTQ